MNIAILKNGIESSKPIAFIARITLENDPFVPTDHESFTPSGSSSIKIDSNLV